MRSCLLKIMETNNYSYKELSKRTGYSVGVLNKFLNGNQVKFSIVLNVIKFLAPEKEKSLIEYYCMNEDKKPDHIKDLTEYLTTNRLFDMLLPILEECKDHKNKDLQQWIEYYLHLYKWKQDEITDYEMFDYIKTLHINDHKLFILNKLLELNLLYVFKQYNMVKSLINNVSELIYGLDEGYIKMSYMARLSEMVAAIELRSNGDMIKVRKHVLTVIDSNIGDMFNGFAYYNLALSYLYEDKDKMNRYFDRFIFIYRKYHSEKQVLEEESKIKKYNAIISNDINSVDDINDDDTLDLYISSIKNGEQLEMIACLSRFISEGDLFLAELPKRALLISEVKEDLINKFF